MTTTTAGTAPTDRTASVTTAGVAGSPPTRRTLVWLALLVVVGFVVLQLSSVDNEPDSPVKDLIASYDVSQTSVRVTSYAGMAFCAALLSLGVAVRAALRGSRRLWVADVALLGFGVLAATMASWAVTGLAMWHAVQIGDETMIRTANLYDTSSFLPVMCGMICLYVGSAVAGLVAGTLPRWLAAVSLVLGVIAPLGPLGFVPFLVLPVWVLAVAVTVRLTA